MATSVKDIKSAFQEDDDVVIPESSSYAKRARNYGRGGGAGAGERNDGDKEKERAQEKEKEKEWWEVDDDEEEYVPLKKRRDQRVTASAARLGHKMKGADPGGGAGPLPAPMSTRAATTEAAAAAA